MDEKGGIAYYIKLSKDDTSRNIMHPYLDQTISVIIRDCMPLTEKIRSKTAGLFYEDKVLVEDRLAFWQKVIEESAQCPPKN